MNSFYSYESLFSPTLSVTPIMAWWGVNVMLCPRTIHIAVLLHHPNAVTCSLLTICSVLQLLHFPLCWNSHFPHYTEKLSIHTLPQVFSDNLPVYSSHQSKQGFQKGSVSGYPKKIHFVTLILLHWPRWVKCITILYFSWQFISFGFLLKQANV